MNFDLTTQDMIESFFSIGDVGTLNLNLAIITWFKLSPLRSTPSAKLSRPKIILPKPFFLFSICLSRIFFLLYSP